MSATRIEYPQIDFANDEVPALHSILADLRSRHAIAPIQYHGEVAYMIGHFHSLQDAMSDDETFPSAAAYLRQAAPSMGKTIQCMGGQEHRRNRALVSVGFRPRIMKEFVEAFLTPVAHELVDQFAGQGQADLVADYTMRYAFTVIARLLDFPPTAFEQLKRWGDGLIAYPWDPEFSLQCKREFDAFLKPLIDRRRVEPGDDLISSLCTAELDGERLEDEEIYSFVRLLFPAGADTTYRGLGSMLYGVITHGDVYEAVRADDAFVPNVVHESLRWEPPTAMLPRFAPKEVVWAGTTIPGNSQVNFAITAANRDPEVFASPDKFDPWRKEKEFLSFGHGLHFCLGSHLARREMEVSLEVLAERLPDMQIVEPENVRITGTVLRGPKSLPVRFGKH